MNMPYRPEGGADFDGGMGGAGGMGVGGGGGGRYMGNNHANHAALNHASVHDSVSASYHDVSAANDMSHQNHQSHQSHSIQDVYGGSPPKAAQRLSSAGDVKLPPVGKAPLKGAAKPPAGGNPRERRLKEGVGVLGGQPAPSLPGRGVRGGEDKKEDLKNARQKELQAKAAERRGNR